MCHFPGLPLLLLLVHRGGVLHLVCQFVGGYLVLHVSVIHFWNWFPDLWCQFSSVPVLGWVYFLWIHAGCSLPGGLVHRYMYFLYVVGCMSGVLQLLCRYSVQSSTPRDVAHVCVLLPMSAHKYVYCACCGNAQACVLHLLSQYTCFGLMPRWMYCSFRVTTLVGSFVFYVHTQKRLLHFLHQYDAVCTTLSVFMYRLE